MIDTQQYINLDIRGEISINVLIMQRTVINGVIQEDDSAGIVHFYCPYVILY